MDPMRLNPVEKYLIEKLQEDFSKANNIEAIYGELDLYTHKVYDISKWLMSFIRRKAYPEVGVDYVVDASDQAIIDSVYDCLSRICNSKDKLLSKDISTGTLSHIKRSHLMANDSKVIFYREAGDKHSFIITCKGISYVYRNRMVECTWEKLLGVYYDDKDSMFYFHDHFNEEPIIKIERYDLLKWDSDYLAVVVCINAICNVFEDTAPQLIEQYDDFMEKGSLAEALGVIEQLISDDGDNGYYHYMKADTLAQMLVKGVYDKEDIIEDEYMVALKLVKEQPHKIFFDLARLKKNRGKFKEARQYYIQAMDVEDRSDKKFYSDEYNDFMTSNRELWNNYTINTPYNERKIIMPVNDISGCACENITVIQRNELPKCIKFPVGHPIVNELYIGHPHNPSVYIPYNDYETHFFLDRVDELSYVLQCLGAKEITITAINGKNIDEISKSIVAYGTNADVKAYSASINTDSCSEQQSNSKSNLSASKQLRFAPSKAPFIPDNLTWYPHEIQWQRLSQQRINGNLLEYHQEISTTETSFVSITEKKQIDATAQHLWMKVSGQSISENHSDSRFNTETIWKVDAVFYPIEQLSCEHNEEYSISSGDKIEDNVLTLSENEVVYREEVLFILEDGEIGNTERRLLERKRIKLGISEERAVDIEKMCVPQLSSEETEYLEIYKEVSADGEITDRKRRLLIREAESLGICKERMNELENLV